jgi:hypothetical protein
MLCNYARCESEDARKYTFEMQGKRRKKVWLDSHICTICVVVGEVMFWGGGVPPTRMSI